MTMKEIGQLIAARRKEKGMLQRELAERAKVGLKVVGNLENGGYCFYGTLEAVCDVLELEVTISKKICLNP